MPQSLEERVSYLEGTVAGNSRNVEDLRELMLQLNRRVDGLDRKVDRFREELADQVSTLDQKTSRQFMWIIGIQVAILLAVVGALLGGG